MKIDSKIIFKLFGYIGAIFALILMASCVRFVAKEKTLMPIGSCAFLPGYLPEQIIYLPKCTVISVDVFLTSKQRNNQKVPESKPVSVEICSDKGDVVFRYEQEVKSPIDGWVTLNILNSGKGAVPQGKYMLRLKEGGDYTPALWWCYASDYYAEGYQRQGSRDFKGEDMLFRVRYYTDSDRQIKTIGAP